MQCTLLSVVFGSCCVDVDVCAHGSAMNGRVSILIFVVVAYLS